MASRLPSLPKMAMSRFPLSSNKENKLKYCFKPRANKGSVSEAVTVELNFHTPISKKYRCVLCRHFLLDPCQVTCCGSFYCKDCIERLSSTSGKCANKKCGKNYSILTDGTALDDLGRKMQQLRVYCLLKSSGCRWVGTVEELAQNHFVSVDYDKEDAAACQFQDANCPNKCGATIPRGKMAEHRLSECQKELSVCEYCGMEDSSYAIFKVHQRMCLSMPVECPKKCGIPGIARSAILSHLETECPLRLTSCKYRHVGCEERVMVINLEEHNTSSYQKHLDLMSEKLEFVSNENAELREENDQLRRREVATQSSQVRDVQLDLGSAEDLLDDISMASSAHGGGSEMPDTLSLSSLMDTVCGGKPKPVVKSGYKSVIDELCTRIGTEGTAAPVSLDDRDRREYVNFGTATLNGLTSDGPAVDALYEVLPDLCADVPQSRAMNENEAPPLPARVVSTVSSTPGGDADADYHRYATVKKKVAKPTSQLIGGKAAKFAPQSEGRKLASQPPEDGNIELLSFHRLNSDPDVPSINDVVSLGVEVDRGSATRTPVEENSHTFCLDRRQSPEPVKGSTDKLRRDYGPSATPELSVNTYMIPRERSAAISAPSLHKYNPKISEAVKAKRRRTPPLPPAPIPPELPTKRRYTNTDKSVPSTVHFQQTANFTSDSTVLTPIGSAPSEIAPIAVEPPRIGMSPTTPPGIEPIPVRPPALGDIGPTPVSVHSSPQRSAQNSSEATALFEPLSSLSNNSPTMSEAIMNSFPNPGACGSNSEFSNQQPHQVDETSSSWHSTILGAIRSSYRTLHQSLQSGSTYSLPAHEAVGLKEELRVVLRKRSSVLCD